MNLSIKGKLTFIDGEWVAEFGHLNIRTEAATPLTAIKTVTELIMSQLEGKNHKHSIRIDENGVFYLTVDKPKPLIKFIAICLAKNYSEKTYEQLNEWFGVEDEA